MKLEELEQLPEETLNIDGDAFKVDKGICPSCKVKMTPIIENKDLFDGMNSQRAGAVYERDEGNKEVTTFM